MEKKTTRKQIDWQQFFITVIGTAIGVALTFVVNGIMERRNKAQAQRLTAIMVIHDIDNSIDIVKKMKEEEERNGELLRFALKQRDHLEGMPFDTLAGVLDVLIDSRSVFSFDTSKEKIFNSDLDTWQNLGNMAFLDNVQTFYHYRKRAQDAMNESTVWERPIPNEEYMQLIMGSGWVTEEEFAAILQPLLEEKLHENRVVYYINVSSSRLDYLTQLIDYWTGLNDENKFLMGLTDQELEDYVNNINKKGVSLTKSKLLGHWVMTVGEQTNEYDFHGDHRYDFSVDYASSFRQMRFFAGRLKMTLSYSGEWAFQGDSLVLTPDYNTANMTVDPSGMVPEENMQDSLDAWVTRYQKQSVDRFKEMADKGDNLSVKALVDSSNDKMEWIESDGTVRYLKRKRE
ncbi:MAG: hypothetical protein IKG92_04330 [Bacteroidales bacterium]|nr:hypothetical protein [Bacteroidales bacterium]